MPKSTVSDLLRSYKISAESAAEDLGYSKETIECIRSAKSEDEVTRIMTNARIEKFG